jgi:hypothetical protein
MAGLYDTSLRGSAEGSALSELSLEGHTVSERAVSVWVPIPGTRCKQPCGVQPMAHLRSIVFHLDEGIQVASLRIDACPVHALDAARRANIQSVSAPRHSARTRSH